MTKLRSTMRNVHPSNFQLHGRPDLCTRKDGARIPVLDGSEKQYTCQTYGDVTILFFSTGLESV